jgi:hypothetical protein
MTRYNNFAIGSGVNIIAGRTVKIYTVMLLENVQQIMKLYTKTL